MGTNHPYKWMFTIIPLYAIGSGLGIFIPLYILSVHGTVFDVGIAIALYNLVSIPSALFWGRLTDKTGRIKPFIVLSAISTLPIIALLLVSTSVQLAFLYYAMYAVAATAASPAINILIIGTSKGSSLPRSYSRFSIFALSGGLLASTLGIAVITNNLFMYAYFLISFNIAAIILGVLLIKKRSRHPILKEQKEKTRRSYPVLNVLISLPAFLLEYNLIEHIRSNLADDNTKRIYQLMTAIALFNLAFFIFYTSLIPFQRFSGLTYSNIFIIQLASILVEIPTFFFMVRLRSFDLKGYYLSSVTLMGTAYTLVILSSFLPTGGLYAINIAAYAIVGFAFAFWNLSSIVLLYDKIRGPREGYYIGTWAGFIGSSAVAGSLISGFISSGYGYTLTFALAVAVVISSGMVFAMEFARKKKKAID